MPPTLATHADHTVWQQSGYRPPGPTGLTVNEYVRAAARSLADPVRVVGTARSARLIVRLAEAGRAVHAVRPDPAAAPLGFPPAGSAEAGRPDPYAPLSVPPPALAGWAAICGLGPLDRHPAAPAARFLGVADADLATFAALVRDPRWFRSADPERPLAAGRLHAFLRLKGRDRPGAVVRWALAAVGRAAPPDRPTPGT